MRPTGANPLVLPALGEAVYRNSWALVIGINRYPGPPLRPPYYARVVRDLL